MSGRLRASFRTGNLAEHLGLLLLKGIAAVAEVSRPEDVGLDAIATLLRSDQDGNCYAEDTFVVQLKKCGSPKKLKLKYSGHQVEWLVGQTLPLFIGLVSPGESQISLYPTLFINHAVMMLHAKKVTVRFGCSGLPSLFSGQESSPWKGDSGDGAIVWLGKPLVQWTLGDFADATWAGRVYEILKRFLAVAHREIGLLSFGQCSIIEWSTNDANSIKSNLGPMKGHPKNIQALAERCAPCLRALMLHGISAKGDSGNSLMISLITMAESLRKMGAEIDPENLFGKFFFALRRTTREAVRKA